ncbi:signal transduction histidine kinase/EAL domain-containing protein (putative c-di-GMP-specific phosphodiesterase class I)/CheY-like chemotaxis protein [Caulobacter ginsengisoli]|uniref:histidine kinase n=1 Tax=Caulobacter ginsengisoli TaxID=400775 RepID=A0ABU0IY63_9CAUL|nr:EAL domain-containing protein [Caulobacter ginsengisoli]MDQ0466956.1 signal transduction histidine kinase/EAL domain-containing protein (putative c-di-GMP-specific phosphodiesterase class I)/CheY-like chemotaxis protein [Caulobacter ginsengisoli]
MPNYRRKPTLRTRLGLLVLCSVGVAVALATGVSAWREARREAAAQADRLVATARVLASIGAEPVAAGDRAQAFTALRSIAQMPGVTYARIEDAGGRVLVETGSGVRLSRDARVGQGGAASFLDLLGSRAIEARAPVISNRRTVGQVVLLGQVAGVQGRLAGGLLVSLLAGLAAALVGLLTAARLQRKITAPIQALRDAMGQVREHHAYDRPVEVATPDAETQALVEGFNAMLAEIRDRDDILAQHMAGLERTVAERTADLAAAKDAAESANSAKSDFLAAMSHEIRTPMNGVMVMAEMLAAGDMPPKQRRFAEVIAKSGASLLAIINDILDFSKIEAGKMEIEAEPLDPAEAVEDVLSLFWERARSKGLDLAAWIDPATPARIAGDPTRLRQVIGNLVNNAIKFTETGGVLVGVAPAPGGGLRVSVTDSGVGIAADKLDAVFGAFTQADQSTTRKFGGTGLGLAICKRLVEAMGGQIGVTSQVGRGSTFAFTAPFAVLEAAPDWPRIEGVQVSVSLAGPCTRQAVRRYLASAGAVVSLEAGDEAALLISDPEGLAEKPRRAPTLCVAEYGDVRPGELIRRGAADALLVQPLRRRDLVRALSELAAGRPLTDAASAQVQAEEAALPSFAGRRVLVADDSAVNREVALEALSRFGVAAAIALDGREAVAAVAADRFDLVLMDGSMPEMDGFEASREIRRLEGEDRHTPIVALTAHVVGSGADAWRAAGMDGVLHKPFTLAALAEMLGRFMTPSQRPTAPASGPAPTTAAADGELFDPAVAEDLARMAQAGQGDFVARVRALYRDNAPAQAEAVIKAAEADDAEGAARAAHALKSMSLNLGARAVSQRAEQIEQAARNIGTVDRAAAHDLYAALTATLRALGEPTKAADDRDALIADLSGAAKRGEFSLVYQPQVGRDGDTLVGTEALIRWTCPKRGPISPGQFIPLAEQAGLARSISRWVIARALDDTADLEGLVVSVNISATEIGDPGFVDELQVALSRRGFDPRRLEIEITETAMLHSGEETRKAIERLQALGVAVALDDFGTGFSSLSHLRLFPFNTLKIDRAFVAPCAEDVTAGALVHALVSIGRAMGVRIVAEGVETEEQRQFLKLAGVSALQGYLTGRPAPLEDLRARWSAGRRAVEAA